MSYFSCSALPVILTLTLTLTQLVIRTRNHLTTLDSTRRFNHDARSICHIPAMRSVLQAYFTVTMLDGGEVGFRVRVWHKPPGDGEVRVRSNPDPSPDPNSDLTPPQPQPYTQS